MRLKALQNDLNAYADALSLATFLLALDEGRVSNEEGNHVILPLSFSLQSDVQRFCWAIFTCIESNNMVDNFKKRIILMTRNSELEEMNTIA